MKSISMRQKHWNYFALFGTVLFLILGAAILPLILVSAQKEPKKGLQPAEKPGTYLPEPREVTSHPPVNIADVSRQEELNPPEPLPWLDAIPKPKGTPPVKSSSVPIILPPDENDNLQGKLTAPIPSVTGISPGPTRTVQGEFLSGTSIPPDTMGTVGMNHIVTVSNNQMRITDRNGVQLTRMTLTSFWAGVTIKGAAVSAFDPKILYDRFNDRYILASTFNAQSISSGVGFAVSQTGDPTGLWNRYTAVADPVSTAGGGHWIDYPSIGFNKNWIVIDYNTFNYGTAGNGYWGQQVFILDKQAAYANTLGTISLIEDPFTNCVAPFETKLSCGFTMVPTVNEDNLSNTVYLVEDWDSQAGQLRLAKITGTPAAPVLTVGTQFPQSTNSWRFNALRLAASGAAIAGASGGYVPQRQQSANLASPTRIMANDSRIQNAVLRNGSLWTTHTVMLAATPTAAGVAVGGAGNPDIRSAIQWWQVDPTIETGLSTPPLQRGRIEDPTADNCHDGNGLNRAAAPCSNSTLSQVGQFFAFPSISANKDNDVLIGFTQFSPLTYPSGAYAIRRGTDPVNTMRDLVVFRPGQGNYNIAAGVGTSRQSRWGDYSASQTDPVNDTDFWTNQEYSGNYRDFGIGLVCPWETWWANVKPGATPPVTTGNLIISEFRLRGPQGVRDEFIELYNPGSSPVIVNTADNSEGWTVAYSTNGTAVTNVAVIPNGTVIAPGGHFLVANSPDSANGPAVVYGLTTYPSDGVRGANSDVGYAIDLADNGGIAIFKTSNTANFNAGARMDSVGFSGITVGLFKEGAGIPDVVGANLQGSFFRNLATGVSQDTNDNIADFIFADTAGTLTAAGQRLGAPGPENLSSPFQNNIQLPVGLFDGNVSAANAPNQFYNPAATGPNATNGTVSVRRNILNNTGTPINRLRFRITAMPTFPSGGGLDLRLLSSPDIMVMSTDPVVCAALPTPCNLSVKALTVESPPTQALGGGINSSAFAGFITFANPLPINGRINMNFLFGVESGTPFTSIAPQAAVPFAINAEAIVAQPLAPTAANVPVSGIVRTNGQAVTRAVVTLIDSQGNIRTAMTNNFGFFRFENVEVGQNYTVSVSSKGLQFSPQILTVNEEINGLELNSLE